MVVEGDAGVGKTSFVNRVKHDLAAHGVRTPEQPIRVTADTTLQSFVGDLRNFLRLLSTARDGSPTGMPSRARAGALVARLVTQRVLRPTHEDHTGRYHAVAGHVAVALEAALGA